MDKIILKFKSFFNYFFIGLMALLTIASTFIYALPYYSAGKDHLMFQSQNIIALVVVACLITGLFYFVIKYLKPNKYVVAMLLVVSLLVKMIWMNNFPLEQYFDMTSSMTYAMDIFTIPNTLPYKEFHYLMAYSYNIPLVLLNVAYLAIAGIEGFLQLARGVNLVALVFIDLGIYLIAKEVANKKVALISLVAAVLFFPLTGMVSLVYNDVNSCVLFVYATYFFIKYIKGNQKTNFVICCVFLLLGNALRSLGLIFAIAFVIILIMDKKKKGLIASVILMSSLFMFNVLLSQSYYWFNIIDPSVKDVGIPISHYIAIGASAESEGHTAGYYLPYLPDYIIDNDLKYDKEAYGKLMGEKIADDLSELGIIGSINHYMTKFLYQWTDGTFETGLINNLLPNKEDSPLVFQYETPIHTFITTSGLEILILQYAKSFWYGLLVILLVSGYIFRKESVKNIMILGLKLIIMGIMGFYVIWEISPHYSFVSLPYFIVLFGYYSTKIVEKVKNEK